MTIDPSHSRVSFAVRHMMLSKIRGDFTQFSGTVQVGKADLPSHVNVSLTVASINTNEKDRDTHLKSADFFDEQKFPTITFESTNVHPDDDETFIVHGSLTMHGITKTIELTGQFEGQTIDPWGKHRIAYSAWTRINRKDFGLVWNQTLETGGLLVGEDIDILLDIQAVA